MRLWFCSPLVERSLLEVLVFSLYTSCLMSCSLLGGLDFKSIISQRIVLKVQVGQTPAMAKVQAYLGLWNDSQENFSVGEKFVFMNKRSTISHFSTYSAEWVICVSHLRAFIFIVLELSCWNFRCDSWNQKKSEGNDSSPCPPSSLWSGIQTQHWQSQSVSQSHITLIKIERTKVFKNKFYKKQGR